MLGIGQKSMEFEVPGLPPAKNEALSMFNPDHRHAPRVRRLLAAAQGALVEQGDGTGFENVELGIKVTVTYSGGMTLCDLSNFLGGIADVLEDKGHRYNIEHLGALTAVSLYDNDRQLVDTRIARRRGDIDSYTVRLWTT
jgi:hypothetical protein